MIGALLMRSGVTRSFRALNRKDHRYLMEHVDPHVVLEYPGHTPMGGRFEGRDAYESWLRRWFEHMFSIEFQVRHVTLEHPWALGLTNTAIVEWEVRETSRDGNSVTMTGTTVSEFRGGKLVAQRVFEDEPAKLDVVWGMAAPRAA